MSETYCAPVTPNGGIRCQKFPPLGWSFGADDKCRSNYFFGAFQTNNYWSATENNANNAWNVNFNDGSQNNNNKTNGNYVRCIRGKQVVAMNRARGATLRPIREGIGKIVYDHPSAFAAVSQIISADQISICHSK